MQCKTNNMVLLATCSVKLPDAGELGLKKKRKLAEIAEREPQQKQLSDFFKAAVVSSERDIGNHAERSLLDAGEPVISADAEDANEWKHLWRCRSFESRKSERFGPFKEWCMAQGRSTLGRKHSRSAKIGAVGRRQLGNRSVGVVMWKK